MSTPPALQKSIEQHVSQKLLPALGYSGKRFSLTETNLGIHNHVFFLDIAGCDPLVVKGIKKKGRFRALCDCAAHLAEKGIPVPGIVYAQEDNKVFGKLGFHIACEERIVGQTLFERRGDEGLIAQAARLFSSMHRITRSSWGGISEQKAGGLFRPLIARVQEKVKKWQAADASFPRELIEDAFVWLESWRKPADAIAAFSLSHGDPNPGNIIVNSLGRMFLLDTGHIRYLPRAIDFYTLEINLCRDDAVKIKVFEDAYFEGMPEQAASELRATAPFFRLYVFISFASMLAQRLAGTAPGQAYYEEYAGGLKITKQIIEQVVGF